MAELELSAEVRTQQGKGEARRLRRTGKLPAVIYGRGEARSLTCDAKKLRQILSTTAGSNAIFQLNLEGEDFQERKAIVKEIQYHPLTGEMLHADLYEISMDKEIIVSVPVRFVGEPVGVKLKGGVLSHLLREIEVECLPARIPEAVTLDVSQLDIGDALHVSDLVVGEGVQIVNDPEEAVVSVTSVTLEEVAKPAEEVLAEGEVAAATAEPQAEAGKEKEKEKERDRGKAKE